MQNRFKFRTVLKTDRFTILVEPFYVLEDSYFIDINKAETEFKNKYPQECFWDFIEEIKKQDYIQEISIDSDLIITEDFTNLMQCTGLKDKNGKLIYEGDILYLYVSTKKLYRYEVKYEIGSFMLVSDDEIFDFKNVWNDNVYPLSQLYYEYQNEENCIYQCQIIGNIYENPELLKDIAYD